MLSSKYMHIQDIQNVWSFTDTKRLACVLVKTGRDCLTAKRSATDKTFKIAKKREDPEEPRLPSLQLFTSNGDVFIIEKIVERDEPQQTVS